MIGADEVMPLLLAACPSFEVPWRSVVEEENLDDTSPTGRLGYVDAADFIRHLAGLVLDNRLEELPAVFGVIERLVVEGDEYVSNLGVIGYLEGLQMETVSSFGLDSEVVFRPYFGPISDLWWERLNRFWAGDITALQEPSE